MSYLSARRELNGMTKVDMEEYFDDVEVESLYSWIDRIQLSRPKKNISKDFSDAVLCAEVVKHYFPRMVEIHNYQPGSATKHKLGNWYLLNQRVLRKLDLDLSDDVLRALANGKPKVIERVLMLLRLQIDKYLEKTGRDEMSRRRELYHVNPDPVIRLRLNTPPSHPNTPPGIKSPRVGDTSNRSTSPNRLTKSEGGQSPRKASYKPGEIPHSHPDRTRDVKSDTARHAENRQIIDDRSYFADKPIPLGPKPFLPPVTDNISRVLYEEKEMECHAKEETIQILNAKIRRLEQLLHLKDVRIEDLHTTLQQTIGYGYTRRR